MHPQFLPCEQEVLNNHLPGELFRHLTYYLDLLKPAEEKDGGYDLTKINELFATIKQCEQRGSLIKGSVWQHTDNKETILMKAAKKGNYLLFKAFVDEGADPNLVTQAQHSKWNGIYGTDYWWQIQHPLEYFLDAKPSEEEAIKVIELLLKNNYKWFDERTPEGNDNTHQFIVIGRTASHLLNAKYPICNFVSEIESLVRVRINTKHPLIQYYADEILEKLLKYLITNKHYRAFTFKIEHAFNNKFHEIIDVTVDPFIDKQRADLLRKVLQVAPMSQLKYSTYYQKVITQANKKLEAKELQLDAVNDAQVSEQHQLLISLLPDLIDVSYNLATVSPSLSTLRDYRVDRIKFLQGFYHLLGSGKGREAVEYYLGYIKNSKDEDGVDALVLLFGYEPQNKKFAIAKIESHREQLAIDWVKDYQDKNKFLFEEFCSKKYWNSHQTAEAEAEQAAEAKEDLPHQSTAPEPSRLCEESEGKRSNPPLPSQPSADEVKESEIPQPQAFLDFEKSVLHHNLNWYFYNKIGALIEANNVPQIEAMLAQVKICEQRGSLIPNYIWSTSPQSLSHDYDLPRITLFILACKKGNPEIIKLCLENGANINDHKDKLQRNFIDRVGYFFGGPDYLTDLNPFPLDYVFDSKASQQEIFEIITLFMQHGYKFFGEYQIDKFNSLLTSKDNKQILTLAWRQQCMAYDLNNYLPVKAAEMAKYFDEMLTIYLEAQNQTIKNFANTFIMSFFLKAKKLHMVEIFMELNKRKILNKLLEFKNDDAFINQWMKELLTYAPRMQVMNTTSYENLHSQFFHWRPISPRFNETNKILPDLFDLFYILTKDLNGLFKMGEKHKAFVQQRLYLCLNLLQKLSDDKEMDAIEVLKAHLQRASSEELEILNAFFGFSSLVEATIAELSINKIELLKKWKEQLKEYGHLMNRLFFNDALWGDCYNSKSNIFDAIRQLLNPVRLIPARTHEAKEDAQAEEVAGTRAEATLLERPPRSEYADEQSKLLATAAQLPMGAGMWQPYNEAGSDTASFISTAELKC
jgi:hypothetical protein